VPGIDDKLLRSTSLIGAEWPETPRHGYVHVFATVLEGAGNPTHFQAGECFIRPCPSSGYVTNVLLEGFGPLLAEKNFVDEYQDIFIKVATRGAFQDPDIELNGIFMHREAVPDFVAKFEQKLDSKPGVARDVCCSFTTFLMLLF